MSGKAQKLKCMFGFHDISIESVQPTVYYTGTDAVIQKLTGFCDTCKNFIEVSSETKGLR